MSVDASGSDTVVSIEDHHAWMHARLAEKQEFHAELDEVAGFFNAQTGRLVDLVNRMLEDPTLWSGVGVETPEKYLAWRVGISLGHAKRIVAIAERSAELPITVDALRAGELSEDQVWPVVKRAPAWADEQSASYAKRMTVVQIQRTMRAYPFDAHATDDERAAAEAETAPQEEPATETAPSPTDDEAPSPRLRPDDVCWYGQTDDGRWRLHLECDLTDGLVIETALDERRDRIFSETGEPADGIQALLAMAGESVGSVPDGRRERTRIGVFIDPTDEHLADRLGRALPAHVAEHLCCDGVVNPILLDDGVPVSVGRSQRIVPDRTRRIVERRDGGCRAPGCTAEHHLEIHHVIHWSDEGPTDTWNLVCLCPHHHRLHHRGRLGITGNADDHDGLRFTDAGGRPIEPSGARPTPPSSDPPPISGEWRHALGEPLQAKWLSFFRDGVDDVRPLPRPKLEPPAPPAANA